MSFGKCQKTTGISPVGKPQLLRYLPIRAVPSPILYIPNHAPLRQEKSPDQTSIIDRIGACTEPVGTDPRMQKSKLLDV
jgi:hypothetical protein